MGYKSEQGDIAGLKADPVTLFPMRGGGLKEPPRGNDDCSITHACIYLKLLVEIDISLIHLYKKFQINTCLIVAVSDSQKYFRGIPTHNRVVPNI